VTRVLPTGHRHNWATLSTVRDSRREPLAPDHRHGAIAALHLKSTLHEAQSEALGESDKLVAELLAPNIVIGGAHL